MKNVHRKNTITCSLLAVTLILNPIIQARGFAANIERDPASDESLTIPAEVVNEMAKIADPDFQFEMNDDEQPVSDTVDVSAAVDGSPLFVGPPAPKRLAFRFFERVWHPAGGEHSRWSQAPIKIIAYPLAKIQYDIPNLMTSLFTESVTRSPLQNLAGVWDAAVHTLRLLRNGLMDFGKGILNPRNAAVVDGILEMGDAAFNVAEVATGVVKSVVSIVGYPVFRLFGGKASVRNSIHGKRAAIVLIDTGVAPSINLVLDPYGEQIVRYHLKGVVNYYCAVDGSNYHRDGKYGLDDCLKNIPSNIKKVDLIALTHSGGMSQLNHLADRINDLGYAPGLMVSIGCGDSPSFKTAKEDTFGQRGLSWAVHFYLSNAIAKRLRGMPMDQAATEAYYEGIALPNLVNPISLGAMIAIGYKGSKPDVR